MHIRESQNSIVSRAVADAARALPVIRAAKTAAAKTAPVAAAPGDVLRCGVQAIDEAVMGQ